MFWKHISGRETLTRMFFFSATEKKANLSTESPNRIINKSPVAIPFESCQTFSPKLTLGLIRQMISISQFQQGKLILRNNLLKYEQSKKRT